MAEAAIMNNVTEKMNNIAISESGDTNESGNIPENQQKASGEPDTNVVANTMNGKAEIADEDSYWGFSLHEAYKMAIKFYKENEGKRTFAMSYEDKVYLAALTKQVSHGPFSEQSQLPEIGYLDMFGNDRRRVWESLEDMSSNDSRRNFIKHLQNLAPVFAPFMVAHQKQKEEEERKRQEEERRRQEEEERIRREEEEEQRKEEGRIEEERVRQEQEKMQIEQKRQIMAALNEQTAQQFQQYAAQQFPGNPEQQAVLIAQLQEQHYQQYMQLYIQQQQQGIAGVAQAAVQHPAVNGPPGQMQVQVSKPVQVNGDGDDERSTEESDEVSDADSLPRIADASIWTRPQIVEFKDQIKRDPESVLTVGRGEVVTVRVPTHEEGAYVFWEFATDYYDLGFGVYFEWSEAAAQQVSVHVNESSEEEGSEEEGEVEAGDDIEKGSGSKSRPATDEIVPVFRRECHSEVHAGSHRYPGRGVYLLKFDNSYSLWRSKTLYYRVYYTR